MKTKDSIYKRMGKMAKLTVDNILAGKVARAHRLLAMAEKLFSQNNNQLRCAVANVFVYQVSTLLLLHHQNPDRFFPVQLMKEYRRQCNAC